MSISDPRSDQNADDRASGREGGAATEVPGLVSIVLTTYRRPDYLDRAVRCVLQQTYPDWELIVVDDNAPDSEARRDTEAVMARYLDGGSVRYLRHTRNQGGSAARNTGVRAAHGAMVAFLDDDDEWLPEKLERQVARLEASGPDVALVYTGFHVLDTHGRRKRERMPRYRGELYPAIVATNLIGTTSSVLCRRRALFEVGLFDESLPGAQDRDLYVRLCERYRVDYVDAPLVRFNSHDGERITKNKQNKIRAQALLEDKYQDVLAEHPHIYSTFLCTTAVLMSRAGDVTAAAATFRRAWLRDPSNLRALGFWFLSSLGSGVFEALRDSSRTLRRAVRKRLQNR